MTGLARICKLYGEIKINGVRWVYDYASEQPVRATDMPQGCERWRASERARHVQFGKGKTKRAHTGI